MFACASGPSAAPHKPADLSPLSLYPLREGAAWSYDVDAGDGEPPVLATSHVLRVQGAAVEVQSGQAVLRYTLLPDGIQRADGGTYLLRAPIALGSEWPAGLNTQARVTALDQLLQTPAGNLESCVVVTELGADSGRKVTTTYCPGVGPASVVSEMEVRGKLLRVTATLRGYSLDAL
ncbi:MAG TPA: hypothetical protein VFN67_03595 [Polyangiales bacterium]|nr:hypothetical protein [Polyangiales bacterium]